MRRAVMLLLVGVALTRAEDFQTTTGKEYRNATVTRVEADGIVVMTSDGVEKIPWRLLAPELREKFGYNPRKEVERAAQKSRDRGDVMRRLKAALEQEQRELDKGGDPDEAFRRGAEIRRMFASTVMTVQVRVEQRFEEGVIGSVYRVQGETPRSPRERDARIFTSLGTAFIYGIRRDGGETWIGKVYDAGQYRGSAWLWTRTLRAFATTIDEAILRFK